MSSAVKRLVPITALNTEQTFVECLLMNPWLAEEGFLASADEWQNRDPRLGRRPH